MLGKYRFTDACTTWETAANSDPAGQGLRATRDGIPRRRRTLSKHKAYTSPVKPRWQTRTALPLPPPCAHTHRRRRQLLASQHDSNTHRPREETQRGKKRQKTTPGKCFYEKWYESGRNLAESRRIPRFLVGGRGRG